MSRAEGGLLRSLVPRAAGDDSTCHVTRAVSSSSAGGGRRVHVPREAGGEFKRRERWAECHVPRGCDWQVHVPRAADKRRTAVLAVVDCHLPASFPTIDRPAALRQGAPGGDDRTNLVWSLISWDHTAPLTGGRRDQILHQQNAT